MYNLLVDIQEVEVDRWKKRLDVDYGRLVKRDDTPRNRDGDLSCCLKRASQDAKIVGEEEPHFETQYAG